MRVLVIITICIVILVFTVGIDGGNQKRGKNPKKGAKKAGKGWKGSKDRNTGVCPFVISQKDGHCKDQCEKDEDCDKGLKCCSNGCANVCVKPVFPIPKPGYCPQVEMPVECDVTDKDECGHDSNCGIFNDNKCCSNGCVMKCTKQPECKDDDTWRGNFTLTIKGKNGKAGKTKECKKCRCTDVQIIGDSFMKRACEKNSDGIRQGCCLTCQLMNFPPL